MFSVGNVTVANEGMNNAIKCVRHRGGSEKVATFAYGMLGGENSMRCIWAHVTEKTLHCVKKLNEIN